MPVTVNGRKLGVARNGVFTSANTDPIAGGKLWPEAAAAWNAMRAAAIVDGIEPWEFVPAGPASSARTYGQQRELKAYWTRMGQPGKAATPGTSNHGWAIAVDVKTARAAAWLMKHGSKYGWSWDEGRRVGEWWHWRLVRVVKLPKQDRLRGYPKNEKRWIRELDGLRRARRDPDRQRVLVRELTMARKRIWRAAQSRADGGDGKGWTALRRRRYRSLLARTK